MSIPQPRTGVSDQRTSSHAAAVRDAADQLARSLHVTPDDAAVVFTAGPSEATRSLLLDHAREVDSARRYLVATSDRLMLAHYSSVLAARSVEVRPLRATRNGMVDLASLDDELAFGADLISVQAVDRDTGVMQPLMAIAARARRAGALLHIDATHAWGFVPLSPANIGAHAVTLAADTERDADGVGALVRIGAARGGGVALGTTAIAGIEQLGARALQRSRDLPSEIAPVRALQRRLERALVAMVHGASVIGASAARSPWITCAQLPNVDVLELLDRMPSLTSWSAEPGWPSSLGAMGYTADEVAATLRIELRPGIAQRDIDALIAQLDFAINGGSA